ncbi:MAG TPA: insulinase family protein [Pyrinomonadaceae bacterium]|jgi:predicted Zn-dependent peptidase
MKSASFVKRLAKTACVCLLLSSTGQALSNQAQITAEPQREKLLNGLKVLIWSQPGTQDVLIKLRIHSGAAFDLAGKAGEMALLGDILFPDPATREYFTDQMQGRLNVVTDYDSITITMQGKANEFERIIEILRNAIVSTQLTPEVVASVRDARIKIVKGMTISPAILADRAIAARLFGDFPYGSPHAGTPESIGRVERADLMLARDRFLNPNNATLTISGGVQSSRVMRTLRQLMGIWRKSEQVVPSTFRQPQPPDQRTLIVNAPGDDNVELRIATRGLARSDRNAAAALVLANIARSRWEKLVPELGRNPMFVRHEARVLPGIFVMGATVKSDQTAKTFAAAKEVLKSLVTTPATATELDGAKSEVLVMLNNAMAKQDGLAEAWLDLDTYKLSSIPDQIMTLQNLSPSDLQRTARQLFETGMMASVAVGNAELVKNLLERETQVELLGASKPDIKQPETAPATKPSSRPD